VTTSAPGQLSSGDLLHLILHASLPRFPEKKLELSILSGIEPSTSKASRRLLHQERCFDQVNKYPLFASDNPVNGFLFYFISFVVNTASVRLVFGMVSFFLSGKHLHGSLHNLREFHQFGFFIYLTTTWLDPGRVFGCIYNWAGILIQAACYLFLCFSPFFFMSFGWL
jgi:hypothetical protein